MSPSVAVPVFDASNSHVFEEGVEREAASNKRTFMNEQVWGFIVFPAMFAFLAYFLLTSGLPLWQVAALITLLGALQTTMVVIAVRSFRRPRIHPVKITSDGALVLGPRRWELRSVTVIERSGRMLTFKDRGGKRVLTVNDYQVGDFGSFISTVNRIAPEVVVRQDLETQGPHLIRLSKM